MDQSTQTNPVNIKTLVEKIETPSVVLPFMIFMFFFITIVLILLYGNLSIKMLKIVSIIYFSLLAIGIFLLFVLPAFKSLKEFIFKFKKTFFVVFYVIGLVIFLREIPHDIITKYSYLFTPIIILAAIYFFYNAIGNTQGVIGFDVNLERIKYALLYLCFIFFIIILFTSDPGGYVKAYFGPLLLTTILLSVFGFLFLITMMMLPNINKINTQPEGSGILGFFKGFTPIGLGGAIVFSIFTIIVFVRLLTYPGGFMNTENTKVTPVIIELIIIFTLWIIFFGVVFYEAIPRDVNGSVLNTIESYTGIAKQTFLVLFGIIFLGILIGWIVTGVHQLHSKSGIISFVLNLFIILVVLYITFKLISGGNYYEKYPSYRLFVNIIFYIPCFFFDMLNKIGSIAGVKVPLSTSLLNTVQSEKTNTPGSYYVILLLVIIGYIVYFWLIPQLRANIAKQGGTILVNYPVPLNVSSVVGSYDSLNHTSSTEYDYQYAISFWFNLESVGGNANKASNQFTSILNYGGKPNILFNAVENKIKITMTHNGDIIKGKELDVNGDIILYVIDGVLLQRWNNIIFNYNGGTVDIFYNGDLVKTIIEVVPIMTKDLLVVGTDNGVYGQICNVNYFNVQLSLPQINNLYEIVKNRQPPVASQTRQSIIGLAEKGAGINNPTSYVFKPKHTVSVNEVSSRFPDASLNDIDPRKVDTSYLSEKWYFDTQGDRYNGL
jgi:Concanavalin A-like lectin/glucanases superfamily